MRLLFSNTEGKIFAKLSMHVEAQSAGPDRIKVPARKQFITQAL